MWNNTSPTHIPHFFTDHLAGQLRETTALFGRLPAPKREKEQEKALDEDGKTV